MKIFSRVDTSTVRQTLNLYIEEAKRDKRTTLTYMTLIPLGHFLYIVLLPLLISLIIQTLLTDPQSQTLYWLIGGMVVTSLLTLIVNFNAFPALFNQEEAACTRLTVRAQDTLLQHSHQFFANKKVGTLAGDINNFGRSYISVFDAVFLQAMPILVNFVTSLIIIAILSPMLFLPLTLLTTFVVLHSMHALNKRSKYRNKRKILMSKLFGSLADIISNQSLVRLFSAQQAETANIREERLEIQRIAKKEIDVIEHESIVRQFVLFSFQILIIVLCIYLFQQHTLSIAALIFTITYLGRITGSMFNISAIVRNIEQGFLDASAVTELLYEEPEVKDIDGAVDLRVDKGLVRFDNVSFQYKDSSAISVINSLDLTIKPRERIGLAGHSGGGKTTMTQLLLRLFDVQKGTIQIDGQDISLVTQQSLRDNIAYVPQEPLLFHRTLRENIAYGKPDATDEEVIDAARRAYAYDFITAQPQQLDTVVGERGVKLSGGQRQRIAIARAIIKDAPILILDEATSALDSESEVYIQKALDELMRNKTCLVVAHRLSTIAKLDRIIVLENGRLIEQGTHQALIHSRGTYSKLWAHQTGGIIEE